MSNESSEFKNQNELYKHFNEFRTQGKFYDVAIKIEDRSFLCHRIILASALKYFRRMFSGEFYETAKKEIVTERYLC